MSSPIKENEESSSSNAEESTTAGGSGDANTSNQRPPAKRHITPVIEISDTESDDSDVCAVNSYQASADEVKRIRREYSSSSSSSEYSSDSESPWEDDSVVIEDKIAVKAVRAQLNPRANRMDDPKLNSALKSQELIEKIKANWHEEKDHTSDEVTLTCNPFRLCRLHGLLENPEIINNIVDDMNTLDWSRKKMDLYEFHQTTDLANLTWQRSIRGIYELLKTEIMTWVSQVTNLELTSVSASCSLYGPGDHLLVHDDQLGDRRVAFILYLAPWSPRPQPQAIHNGSGDTNVKEESKDTDVIEELKEGGGWRAHMGGALELFARDAEGAAARVRRRVFPANNTLAFFAVGPDSFHQVGEVLSLELPRLSINGWFHGPAPEPCPLVSLLPPSHTPHNQVVVVSAWLDGAYMSARARAALAAHMERASEASLRRLLLPARADALLRALQDPDIEWEQCGPAQQRRYRRVSEAWLRAGGGGGGGAAHEVRALWQLLSSATWLRVLAECTDLQLTTYRQLEIQKWTAADFTLLPPREHYDSARLEAVLCLGAPRALRGGVTLYVAPEDAAAAAGGALVAVPPRHNALSLVYCDAGATSFTKYVSRLTLAAGRCFYLVVCTYQE
ncbi:unnamed protein product, partial [Brenthis ino]